MPASASGVSKTRRAPNCFCKPSVTRKTPPSLPTSSPKTSVRSSSLSATRSPSRSASCIEKSAISQLLEPRARVLACDGRRLLVDEAELLLEARRLERRELLAHALDLVLGVRVDRVEEARVHARSEQSQPGEPERVELAPGGFLLGGAVTRGIVRGCVRTEPVGERLDHGRAAALACPRHRGLSRVVHCDDVVPVDLDARQPVALRPRGDRAAADLRFGGHGDRPAVVLAEE